MITSGCSAGSTAAGTFSPNITTGGTRSASNACGAFQNSLRLELDLSLQEKPWHGELMQATSKGKKRSSFFVT